MWKISRTGMDLIKEFEGCKLKAYLCQSKVPTIGYGRTRYPNGTAVQLGDTCTQAQADAWLIEDVAIREGYVNELVTRNLNQNRFDALVSFTFNVGRSPLAADVAPYTNMGDHETATKHMKLYKKSGDQVLEGLVRRREAEVNLYNKAAYGYKMYMYVDHSNDIDDYRYTMKINPSRSAAFFDSKEMTKVIGKKYLKDLIKDFGFDTVVTKYVGTVKVGSSTRWVHEWKPAKIVRDKYKLPEKVYITYKST